MQQICKLPLNSSTGHEEIFPHHNARSQSTTRSLTAGISGRKGIEVFCAHTCAASVSGGSSETWSSKEGECKVNTCRIHAHAMLLVVVK